MPRSLYYALLILLISSCCKEEINEEMEEEEETPIESISCYEDLKVSEYSCENYINEQDSIYCEPEYLGSYVFDDLIKNTAKVYCIDNVNTLKFQNSTSEIIEFNIKKFYYLSARYFNPTSWPCPSDTTRKLSYCFEQEKYSIWLESEEPSLFFTITIETQPIFVGSNKGKYYDQILIWKQTSPTNHTRQTNIVFGNGNSEYDYKNVSGQEYYESIELNDILYFDVISEDLSNHANLPTKFYISRENGIVGFLTPEGELYNLLD
jgi:hypothetical protein